MSETIVCRCSDLNIDEIRQLIKNGFTTIDELKRIARLGMGACQGRNCIPLVMRELSIATGVPVSEISAGTYRPPTKSITLGEIAKSAEVKMKEGGYFHD